jgi:hypothetical protein
MRRFVLAIGLLLTTSAVFAENTVEGVLWDKVPWESFCKDVKPLPYTSSRGQVCPKVHPADMVWQNWKYGPFSDEPEPKWNCEAKARAYERKRTNIPACKSIFGASLSARAREPEAFAVSFTAWRKEYFGKWLTGD